MTTRQNLMLMILLSLTATAASAHQEPEVFNEFNLECTTVGKKTPINIKYGVWTSGEIHIKDFRIGGSDIHTKPRIFGSYSPKFVWDGEKNMISFHIDEFKNGQQLQVWFNNNGGYLKLYLSENISRMECHEVKEALPITDSPSDKKFSI
jgi:hypothetical protein